MATVSILCLYDEIIEHILQNNCLEFRDVLNFSLTCKSFYKTVLTNNTLWEKKFFQRWPHLFEVYRQNKEDKQQIHSWIETIRSSIQCRNKLSRALSLMSQKNYSKRELAYLDMREFNGLVDCEKHPHAYDFVIDELTTFVNNTNLDVNLTHQYYAWKVLRYLRQRQLAVEWNSFKRLPQQKQVLEKGAMIVSQWSQPDKKVSESQVTTILDGIAETVKLIIKERYPTHPLLFASQCDLDEWRTTIIPDNKWDREVTKQVMNVLCKVIFENLKFHSNSETYYSSENSFIDRVLENKRGTPATLAIVFESVARRLGIRCELACFKDHFLLHFKEKYCHSEAEDVESFYIDVLNGGKFLTRKSCPRMLGNASKCPIAKFNVNQSASAEKILDHIANNLIIAARQIDFLNGRAARLRSALELALLIDPDDISKAYNLVNFYVENKMSTRDILDSFIYGYIKIASDKIEKVFYMLRSYGMQNNTIASTQLRDPIVKFAIGMIMKNRIDGYFCVITGWNLNLDPMSLLNASRNDRNNQVKKPFYNVLIDDGRCQYVPEENLEISPINLSINHDRIGRYFYKYCGNYYLPNKEAEQEYPEDAEVRNQLLSQNRTKK